jgi:hypothetical protein
MSLLVSLTLLSPAMTMVSTRDLGLNDSKFGFTSV